LYEFIKMTMNPRRITMKKLPLILLSLFVIAACTASVAAEDIEYLNEQTLAFALEHMGQKIGRGECWDLAAQPLNALGAAWDGHFGFGKKIGTGGSSGLKLEQDATPMPGDIIHFIKVKASWTKTHPNGSRAWGSETLGMPDHVAFLKEFDGKTTLTLLHQNVNGKRYMVETTLDIANIKSGTYYIYRPWRAKAQ
jgi:hypothetical protein